MFDRLTRLLGGLGLLLLLGAALLLAVGGSPDNFGPNFQAETLANFAYGLLVLAVVSRIVSFFHR